MTKPYYNLLVRRVVGGVQIGDWVHTPCLADRAMAEARYNAVVAAGGHDVRLDRIALDCTPIGSTVAEHCAPRLEDPSYPEYAPRFSLDARPCGSGDRWIHNGVHTAIPHDEINRVLESGGYDVRVVQLEPVVLYRAARSVAAEPEPTRGADLDPRWVAALCALRRGPRSADDVAEAIGDMQISQTCVLLRSMAAVGHAQADAVGRRTTWRLGSAGAAYLAARGVVVSPAPAGASDPNER